MDNSLLSVQNPKGIADQLSCFVDADYDEDQITRRSRTVILILLFNRYREVHEAEKYGGDLYFRLRVFSNKDGYVNVKGDEI